MEPAWIVLSLCVSMVAAAGNSPSSQRFQAEKFLDMLGKSFDPKVAYVDLLSALHQRLNLDLVSNSNSSSSTADAGSTNVNAMAETSANCQEAPPRTGATVTYNSNNHALGSRAIYQCEPGYKGRSKFIQCGHGGQWSALTDWEGCSPVDCGPVPPSVQNADTSYSSTTFGSLVLYSCQAGYKMNTPDANVTCTDTGVWGTPNFSCEQAGTAPMGIDNMGALQSLFGGGGSPAPTTGTNNNPMMAALLKSFPGASGIPSLPNIGLADNPSVLPSTINSNNNNNNNNPMAAMFAQMFPNLAQPSPATAASTTATTTTAKPENKAAPGGFQLPSHLQSLLPNGLSSTSGIRPQDLMTLASVGLGSSNSQAAPKDISQLLGTMHPMSLFGGALGFNTGGAGAGAGAGAAVPPDPERAAEQREEMMMRALMASTMKSMMPNKGGNSSTNPSMDIMTLMALQSGLNGGGSGLGAGAAGAGMDPLGMMLGMGGGGGGSSLLSNLFGA